MMVLETISYYQFQWSWYSGCVFDKRIYVLRKIFCAILSDLKYASIVCCALRD